MSTHSRGPRLFTTYRTTRGVTMGTWGGHTHLSVNPKLIEKVELLVHDTCSRGYHQSHREVEELRRKDT